MLLTVQGHELAHGHVRVGMDSTCGVETELKMQQKMYLLCLVGCWVLVSFFRIIDNRPSLRLSGKTPSGQTVLKITPDIP